MKMRLMVLGLLLLSVHVWAGPTPNVGAGGNAQHSGGTGASSASAGENQIIQISGGGQPSSGVSVPAIIKLERSNTDGTKTVINIHPDEQESRSAAGAITPLTINTDLGGKHEISLASPRSVSPNLRLRHIECVWTGDGVMIAPECLTKLGITQVASAVTLVLTRALTPPRRCPNQ